jgi:hypothetical protein
MFLGKKTWISPWKSKPQVAGPDFLEKFGDFSPKKKHCIFIRMIVTLATNKKF